MKSFMLIFIVVQWFINNIIVINIHSSGVARNFERGFPNDRAGGLGGTAPQKKWGVRGA